MACESIRKRQQTPLTRAIEVANAAKKLEAKLRDKSVTLKIGPTGSITFDGWSTADRDDVSDVCAFRKLQSSGSTALLDAIAKAEIAAGRKIDPKALAAGHHSHDGGKTWHGGH